jgi:Zn-dependent peptidase ImmA (M78 family)
MMPVIERSRSASRVPDRLLLEQFRLTIDGFNVRSQSLNDLGRLCDELEIEVVQMPLRRLHGVALEDDGYKYLYINSRLSGPEKVIAGFHEYCHLTSHSLEMSILKSTGGLWNLQKYERQAQIIGTVALMPDPALSGLSIEEVMQEFGVSRQIAEFRAGLAR